MELFDVVGIKIDNIEALKQCNVDIVGLLDCDDHSETCNINLFKDKRNFVEASDFYNYAFSILEKHYNMYVKLVDNEIPEILEMAEEITTKQLKEYVFITTNFLETFKRAVELYMDNYLKGSKCELEVPLEYMNEFSFADDVACNKMLVHWDYIINYINKTYNHLKLDERNLKVLIKFTTKLYIKIEIE